MLEHVLQAIPQKRSSQFLSWPSSRLTLVDDGRQLGSGPLHRLPSRRRTIRSTPSNEPRREEEKIFLRPSPGDQRLEVTRLFAEGEE